MHRRTRLRINLLPELFRFLDTGCWVWDGLNKLSVIASQDSITIANTPIFTNFVVNDISKIYGHLEKSYFFSRGILLLILVVLKFCDLLKNV